MLSKKALTVLMAAILAIPLAPACGGDGDGEEDTSEDTTPDTADTSGDTAADEGGPACSGGEVECGDECVDLDEDPDHCGACDNACGSDEACYEGSCVTECPDDPDSGVPLTNCGGTCVNTDTDDDHCGECDNACPEGMICGHQECTSEVCAPGEVYCFGHCTSLSSDQFNCGECGNTCDVDTQHCQEGVCVES
jgi:hypothetical protein